MPELTAQVMARMGGEAIGTMKPWRSWRRRAKGGRCGGADISLRRLSVFALLRLGIGLHRLTQDCGDAHASTLGFML
jgi:hypothetical protein